MKKETRNAIIKWTLFGLLMGATIALFILSPQLYGIKAGVDADGNTIWNPISVFNKTVSENKYIQYIYEHGIPNTLQSIQIIGVAVALGVALHYLARITFRGKKALTISKLVASFLKWVIAIAAVFFVLHAWGANTTMMLASAGVVTLIIGLGSQALVADILAGIFIVFEGDFQVGDIVIIDGWRGEIKEIGIRTTKLIDAGGNIKIINNSEIKTIINQTQELSIAKAYVSVSYGTPIEKIEAVIADNIEGLKDKIPDVVEGPFYKGVSELGESAVVLLFVAKCNENDIYQVQRDLNRAIKIMFDENGIEIPFNQLVVTMAEEEKKEKVTKKEQRKAQDFTDEQKELSKDIEIKDQE